MKQFKDFNITLVNSSFIGDKIKIIKILNKEIKVLDFRIEDSKIFKDKDKGNDKCLHMQIEYEKEKRVVFTSAYKLIEALNQIPKSGFPFTTTIVEIEERYEFT